MSELSPALLPEVAAACQANADEVAGTLARTFDGEFRVAVDPVEASASSEPPALEAAPGLVVFFRIGDQGALAVIPESSQLLPSWIAAPDATGESKLGALAQELSMLLLPETLLASAYGAARVHDLAAAATAAAPEPEAVHLRLQLTRGEDAGPLWLLWPVAHPQRALGPKAEDDASEDRAPDQGASPQQTSAKGAIPLDSGIDFSRLPSYSRSFLKVRIPVSVQLARKKETVQSIVELAPGSILKFEKSCDELLHLYAGDYPIAEGEAVKIGDKFGFRVSTIVLPQERFQPVRPYRSEAAG